MKKMYSNAADGNSGKFHAKLLNIRCSRTQKVFFLKWLFLFLILIGMVVIVFHSVSVTGKSFRSKHQNTAKYYTSIAVHPGDTLWSIAEEYMPEQYKDTKEYIEEIMDLNHLHSFQIHSGGFLVIPYY